MIWYHTDVMMIIMSDQILHCQKASRYQRVSELQKRVSEPEAWTRTFWGIPNGLVRPLFWRRWLVLGVLYYVLIKRKQMGAVWAGFREAHFHRVSEIQKRVSEVQKRAYDEHVFFLKCLFPGPAARTAAVLSQECACSLQNKAGGSLYLSAHSIPRSAFMSLRSALMSPRSALMSLTSAGKNGKTCS